MDEAVVVAVVGLVGVVAGSLITAFINYFTVRLTLQKDERTWQREHMAALELRAIEEQMRLEEQHRVRYLQVAENYQGSIQALTLLSSSLEPSFASTLSDKERAEFLLEATKQLSLLSIHLRRSAQSSASEFERAFEHFVDNPTDAGFMLNTVLKISKADRQLFPNIDSKEEKPGMRTVQIGINTSFRQQQFEAGIELPANFLFSCDLTELEELHRVKLWEVYFSGSTIPDRLELRLPSYNPKGKSIEMSARVWQANINPLEKNCREIFNAWVESYNEALLEADRQKENDSQIQA